MQIHNERAVARELGYFLLPGQHPLHRPVWYEVEGAWYDLLASGVRVNRSDLRRPGVRILP